MASKAIKKTLDKIVEELETVKAELEEFFDNHSERWQESDAGETCMSEIESLSNAISSIQEVE